MMALGCIKINNGYKDRCSRKPDCNYTFAVVLTMTKFAAYVSLCFLPIVSLIQYDSPVSVIHSEKDSNGKNVYVRGEMPVEHGIELFNLHCASCHNFFENGIGPKLSGITSEVDKEWLITFVANPPSLIKSGDEHAVRLFKKYKQYMPPFPTIQGEDMEDILGFILNFSEGEKRNINNRVGGLIDPIANKIAFSNLTLLLDEAFRVPPCSETVPITRINKMGPITGNRLFLHDLRGKLYELNKDKTLPTYIDLAEKLPNFIDSPSKGSGFGSWAFHPKFDQNGLFYTTHNEPQGTAHADYTVPDSIDVPLQAVLLEWRAENPKAPTFSGSHRELLREDMVSGAHTFQELTFNPLARPNSADYGLLYLGIGDASMALKGFSFLCDNIEHIWGSVIRIDPEERHSSNGKYGIPEDNPFINTPNAVKAIWPMGLEIRTGLVGTRRVQVKCLSLILGTTDWKK